MKRFVFREDLAERHLEQRIRKVLALQRLVSIEDLCRDTAASADTVRAILDAMIERHEVERLRPLKYEKDDMDFFLLREAPRTFGAPAWNRRRLDSRRGWFDRIQRNLRPPVWARQSTIKTLT